MALDWNKMEEEFGKKFKDFAPEGKHKVKCIGVEIKEVGTNGNYVEKFKFEESDEYQYPTADHWISWKNDNFRAFHQKNLLVALGSTDDKAKLCVEKVESLGSHENIVKGYQKAFDTLLAKQPTIEIEVGFDGKYSRSEFTDSSVAMNGNKKESKASDDLDIDLGSDEGFEIDIDASDMPF